MAKKNNNIWKITIVVFTIGAAIVGIALTYGGLQRDVTENSKDINQHHEKIENHDITIVEVKTDIKYMKEDVAEIKDDMQAQTSILHEVLREVRK